jgi:uncharacterized RDD family membrane protein YckC
LSDEESRRGEGVIRRPVREAEREGTGVAPLDPYREARIGVCPNCDATVRRGALFCRSCKSYLPNRWIGKLASGKRRLLAAFIDNTFKEGGLFATAFWSSVLSPGSSSRIVGILSTIYTIYSIYLWTRGTSPAKKLLGMTVITDDGEPAGFLRMAFRETIGKMISLAVFGLGFLAIPLSDEKRGWHDRMAGTWVVVDEDD